jgi:phosphatidylglycerol---prolipoprotein diacylglyceryl transferase
VYVPFCLFVMAIGFAYGISLGITNARARTVARVLAFVPPVVAYIALKPASFGQSIPYQLSTSQLIGFLSAITVAYFYARIWDQARKNPALAMSLGDAASIRALRGEAAVDEEEEDEDDEEDEEEERAPEPAPAKSGQGKKKGLAAKAASKKSEEPAPDEKIAEPSNPKAEPEPGTT